MNTITKHPNKSSRRLGAGIVAAIFTVMALIFTVCTSDSSGKDEKSAPPSCQLAQPPAPGQLTQPVDPAAAADTAYDLYIMSMCPFGFTGLANLMDLARAFPQRKWNVWFIGRVESDGKLSSMRGEPEIFDETLWLGVKALYPARYQDFLIRRATPGMPTLDLLRDMRFDVARIRRWAEENGQNELREHYLQSVRVGAAASPTLFINGVRYHGAMGRLGNIVRERCRAVDPQPQFCRDYPDCADDNDCVMPGKIGRCDKSGKRAVCEYRDDVPFKLTVLIADTVMDMPSEWPVIGQIRGMLPGADLNVVKFSSEEGKRLTEKYNPSSLPYFHLDKAVEGAFRFATMRERLEPAADGGYQLRRGMVRANYFPQRPEKPGLVEVYADPLMPNVAQIVNVVLSNPDFAKRVVLRPAVAPPPPPNPREAPVPPALNKLRSEEALRWIVLADEFTTSYHPYLKQYINNPGSTYWFNWLRDIRVDQRRFQNRIDASQPRIESYMEDFAAISAGEPVMIMLNNRTKAAVPNEQELERMLKQIIN
jgi:hypothetical protein